MGLADALSKGGITNAKNQGVTQFLSSGYPVLDNCLSGSYTAGGFPVRRLTEIFGPPSAGKTAIATNVMVAAQKAGGVAMFMDHEDSFDIGLATSFGLSDDPNVWVYQQPDSFEASIQKVFDIALLARGFEIKFGEYVKSGEPIIDPAAPIAVVFDSLPYMVPQSNLAGKKGEARDISDRNMRDNMALAMATAAHFPRLVQLANRMNMLVIVLNQPRTGFNKQGQAVETTPGGSSPEFAASVRLRLTRTIDFSDALKKKIGQTITCEVVKNKVYRPFEKCAWYFDFNGLGDGKGKFEVIAGVVDELGKIGKIERNGAWTTWDGKKWNSKRLLEEHIVANNQYPDLLALFPK